MSNDDFIEGKDELQVPGEPNRRVGAFAQFPDDLVLAIVEDVAENNWMITTWAVILHPLAG